MYSQVNDRNSSDRFSVADILSSMANGVGESPATTSASIGGITSGIPTRTTPTLTPTTLKNIEESFLELQSIPAPLEHQHQAGFVPPVVSFSGIPTKQEEVQQWVEDCVQQSAERNVSSPAPSQIHVPTSSAKTGRGGGRRPMKDEKLSPEEEERRRVRRERNKLAAARCRKRRMDHTNNLLQETDGLEEKRQSLQNEIHSLTCEKEELEFLLEAHKATCKMAGQQHSKGKPPEKPDLSKVKSYLRPNSLPLSSSAYCNHDISSALKTEPNVSEIAGVPISTPSSGMFNFDSLIEVNTNLSLSHGALSSCAGQQRSSSSDLSSPDSITPPKLVSL